MNIPLSKNSLPLTKQLLSLERIEHSGMSWHANLTFPTKESLPQFLGRFSDTTSREAKDIINRFRNNPRNALGFAGLYCCLARVHLLGMSKLELSQVTGISRERIAKLESGKSRPYPYRRLLRAFRRFSLECKNSQQSASFEKIIRKIAQLLAQADNLQHPINQLMLEIHYRYGEKLFERHSGFNLASLRARDKKGGYGSTSRNYQTLRDIFLETLTEETVIAKDSAQQVELIWEQPEIKFLVTHEINKKLQSLRGALKTRPLQVKLSSQLLSYISLSGGSNHDRIAKTFNIPPKQARNLTHGKIIPTQYAESIIENLVRRSIIPRSIGKSLLSEWENQNRNNPSQDNIPTIAKDIKAALTKQSLSMNLAAHILEIDIRSPGNALREKIEAVSVETKLFSFHALCCLAANSLFEVDSMIELVLAHAKTLPKNAGNEFSYAFQLTTIYGLQAENFEADVKNAIEQRFDTDNSSISPNITEMIVKEGEKASITALERWIQIMCPENTMDALNSLDARCSRLAPHLSRLQMAQTTMRQYQSGESRPGLRRLKAIVLEAGSIPSKELIFNWYMDTAADTGSETSDFGRALSVLIKAEAGDAKNFHAEMKSNIPSLSMSRRQFQTMITAYSRGERLAKLAEQIARDERILRVLEEAGVPAETLHYVRLCNEIEDVEQRLRRWQDDMKKADKENLSKGLEELTIMAENTIAEPQPPSLEKLFLRKQRINHMLAEGSDSVLQTIEKSDAVKALRCLPGIRLEDLL